MRHLYKPLMLAAAIIAAFIPTDALAQDPRFSQYYNSPWQLNPAMTGVFNGRFRVAANYRDQWNSFLSPQPYRTYAASFDARYAVANDDYFAFGFGAMHDQAGASRFQQNRGNLGISFLKQLSGGRYSADHYLSAGAQLGVGQNSMDWSGLWFSNQFNNGTELPDTNLDAGEPNQNNSTDVFADFNAGLMWYVLTDNEGFFYAGAAMNHLNRPNISFLGNGNERLNTRWNVHAGGQLPMTDVFYLQPGVQVMQQGSAFETDLGMNVRYTNHDLNELALRAGVWGRIVNKLDKGVGMDALTFVAMLELQRWTLGLSYDVTVSGLTRANNSRGAFELSMIYYHPEHRRSRVKCPKF